MKNGVENWLQAVQDEMKVTVQRKLRDGQKSYTEGGRKDWVLL
jgi:hypothetical protein